MRKITFILLFISALAYSQNSILYEISGNGKSHKSYLFGTLHVQNEEAFNFNDSVFWAIDQCNLAAFELDFDLKRNNLDIEEERVEELLKYLAEEVVPAIMEAIPADSMAKKIINSVVPMYKYILSSQFDMSGKRADVVDQYLQNYSRSVGKEILGIETFSEQINAILGDDFTGLKEGILKMFTTEDFFENLMDYPGNVNDLVEAYSKLDYAGICNQIAQVGDLSNPFVSSFYGRIFTDRNELMANRTEKLLAEGPVFIAVGCGHLCGSNGLVQQYRDMGYTVRPIDLSGKKQGLNLNWERREFKNFSVELPKNSETTEEREINRYGYNTPISTNQLFTGAGKLQFSIKQSLSREELDFAEEELSIETVEDIEYDEEIHYEDVTGDREYFSDDMDDYTVDEIEEQAVYLDEEGYEVVTDQYKRKYEISEDSIILYEKEFIPESDEWVTTRTAYDAEEFYSNATIELNEYEEEEQVELEYVDGYPGGNYEAEEDDMEMEEYYEPKKRMNPKDYVTDDMKVYFERVAEIMKAEMKDKEEDWKNSAMKDMFAVSTDTLVITFLGEKQEVYRNTTVFSNSIFFTYAAENGINYEFNITGDPAAIRSEEVLRFITSFKLKP